MGIFDLFKINTGNNSGVVWRDSSGKIRCQGDSCPKECDETCPIYLNMQVMGLMATSQNQEAIPILEKMVKMAPDFYDGWNNLATLNGMIGNHENAYEYYLKAHECAPEKSQPLFGLALSSRELEKYDECIKWCDEYEAIEHDHRTDNIRATALGSEPEEEDLFVFPESTLERRAIAIVQGLLEDERTSQIMDYRGGFPNIPEISMPARSICEDLFQNLQNETDDIDMLFFLTPMWCTYAGMGAVAMWDEDWPKLSKKGIIASLIEDRGYFAMDEFVYDYIGIGWDSDECNDIQKVLKEFSMSILNEATTEDEKFDMTYYFEALKAMYMYGMVFEMNRLGMH